MSDCHITQAQKDASDATTKKALEVGESSGGNNILAQIADQSHASIQPIDRRKRKRRP